MKQKRWLLRFWMLAAAFWAVVVVAFSYAAIVNPPVEIQALVFGAQGAPRAVEQGSDEYKAAEEEASRGGLNRIDAPGVPGVVIFVEPGRSLDLTGSGNRELQQAAQAARDAAQGEARTEVVQRTALFAVVPPLGTLLAGVIVTWGIGRLDRRKAKAA